MAVHNLYSAVEPGWGSYVDAKDEPPYTAHVDFPLCGAAAKVTVESVREEWPTVSFLVDHVEVARLGRFPDEDVHRFNRRVDEVRFTILRTIDRIGQRVL